MAIDEEQEVLEMDEVLEQVLGYAVDEAKTKLIETGELVPFTIVVEEDNMHIESFPDEYENLRNDVRDQIKTASSFASHYAFVYDGYIDTDAGTLDAIIVECAERDQEEAFAIAQIYTVDESGDGAMTFEDGLAYIGPAEMFFDADTVAKAEEAEFAAAQAEMERDEIQRQAAERLEQMKAEQ